MADNRTYYVICADNCKFEGMSKEQIIAAIAEATGSTPTRIDDAFITKVKEQNAGAALKFWVGTQAEYNAITEKEKNCLYILTDETTADDMQAAIEEMQAAIEEMQAKLKGKPVAGAVLFEGYEDEALSAANDFGRTIQGISEYKLFFIECGFTDLKNSIGGNGVFAEQGGGLIQGHFIGSYTIKNKDTEIIAQGVGNGKLQIWFNTEDDEIAQKDVITAVSCSFDGGGYEWSTLEVYKIIGIC